MEVATLFETREGRLERASGEVPRPEKYERAVNKLTKVLDEKHGMRERSGIDGRHDEHRTHGHHPASPKNSATRANLTSRAKKSGGSWA